VRNNAEHQFGHGLQFLEEIGAEIDSMHGAKYLKLVADPNHPNAQVN
jgi:hypothetical protein